MIFVLLAIYGGDIAQSLCDVGSKHHVQRCCTTDKPCPVGHGDCNSDSECEGNLVCGHNNCDQARFDWSDADCCEVGKLSQGVTGKKGQCVKGNGETQDYGLVKLYSLDIDTTERESECLRICKAIPCATACETVYDHDNRGCWIHTKDVADGNGVKNHFCWRLH